LLGEQHQLLPKRRDAQGLGRGPLLVRVGPGAQEIEAGRQTAGI
jgi:hypothetical protein